MGTKRTLSTIDSIVIHCADTPNGKVYTTEQIDQWHGERNPPFERDMSIAPNHQPTLTHIGYHYVIELDGAVKEGRPLIETGAHVAGFNERSIGICLIGRDKFSEAQWLSVVALIQALTQELHKVLAIYGHNHFNSHKSCPGFNVATWIEQKFMPMLENLLDDGA